MEGGNKLNRILIKEGSSFKDFKKIYKDNFPKDTKKSVRISSSVTLVYKRDSNRTIFFSSNSTIFEMIASVKDAMNGLPHYHLIFTERTYLVR